MHSKLIEAFQKTVWEHYSAYGRDLPWRQPNSDGSFDPYKILVSEIMLQQTQVSRVIPKYTAFLQVFPDIQTLAKAPLSDVVIAWSGLGYNRRAKYMHDGAKQLVGKDKPWKLHDLTDCKGIGPNTAAAVLVYAYNRPLVFIETNIRTVYIHHFFSGRSDVSDKEILTLIDVTLDRTNPRKWYGALMDYGTYLKAAVGNASVHSRHHTKQTIFKGSARQIRGQILRLLIQGPHTLGQLGAVIKDYRLERLICNLESEGLIKLDGARYYLAT